MKRPRIFRPHLLLRLGVAMGLVTWMLVTAVAAGLPDMGVDAIVKAAGFALLFIVLSGHYLPLEYEVDENGIIRRSLFGERRITFSDVKGIQILPMAWMVSYGVRTRRAVVAFTSFIDGHKELMELIAERARVRPMMQPV